MARCSHPTWLHLFVLALMAARTCTAQVSPQAAAPKQNQSAPHKTASGFLAIVSDTGGSLFVDGVPKTALDVDKVTTFRLIAGQHFIELRNSNGVKLWEEIADVPEGKQVVKRIQLNQPIAPSENKSPETPLPGQPRMSALASLTNNHDILCALGRFEEAQANFAPACPSAITRSDLSALPQKLAEDRRRYCSRDHDAVIARLLKNGAQKADEGCVFDEELAADLYRLGRHEEALPYANMFVDNSKEALKLPDIPGDLSFPYWNAFGAYQSRALIKYALRDYDGALQDADSAMTFLDKSKVVFVKENKDYLQAQLFDYEVGVSTLHIVRALSLTNLRRFSEATVELDKANITSTFDAAWTRERNEGVAKVRTAIRAVFESSTAATPSSPASKPNVTKV